MFLVIQKYSGPAISDLQNPQSNAIHHFHIADIFGLKADDMINKTDLEAGIPKLTAEQSHIKDIEAWSTGQTILYLKEIGNNELIKFELIPLKDTDNVMGFELGKHCEDADIYLSKTTNN